MEKIQYYIITKLVQLKQFERSRYIYKENV